MDELPVDPLHPLSHLAFISALSLRKVKERIEEQFGCSFEEDAENENAWIEGKLMSVMVNISRPHAAGKLQEWNEAVPPGCNFGVALETRDKQVVLRVARALADCLDCEMLWHPGYPLEVAAFGPVRRFSPTSGC